MTKSCNQCGGELKVKQTYPGYVCVVPECPLFAIIQIPREEMLELIKT